jgi:hypothetical protein
MHSLHSPMNRFHSQPAALAEAQAFMQRLLTVPEGEVVRDPVDEELLGKILRGETVPDLDENGQLQASRPDRLRATPSNLTETTP